MELPIRNYAGDYAWLQFGADPYPSSPLVRSKPSSSDSDRGNPRTALTKYRGKRDFAKTREPAGKASPLKRGKLRFVIQKHAARNLHYDLRLELDGVMKSWAVPKGPSMDPSVKRLAMEVEDHPIEYNKFEGTIPQGEYGGGTVMLWDNGTYSSAAEGPGKDEDKIRDGYKRGDLKIFFHGKRLQGSFALVRMKRNRDGSTGGKPQWLLIKHRDEFASSDYDVTSENMTSVTTGRTMEEITSGKSRVWQSNRPAKTGKHVSQIQTSRPVREQIERTVAASGLEPMLATIGGNIPGKGWTFEPKYDGIRVLAFATDDTVTLITRNDKDKALQFPEITDAIKKLVRQLRRPLVLDGEIVALVNGNPARFQELQGRMHVREKDAIEEYRTESPSAFIVFDFLVDGKEVLIHKPWTERRAALVKRIGKHIDDVIRIAPSEKDNGDRMLAVARREGWEGIIAKRLESTYTPGMRSRDWLKLKIEFRQEFVVGGFTEPRNSRQHIGAMLLGYYDRDRLLYVGHTGGGFTQRGLAELYGRLKPLEQDRSPFEETPKTNERAHWVKPEIVVEVKFNEFTADGKLRQPIYLGTRDDKNPKDVGMEKRSVQKRGKPLAMPVRKTSARARIHIPDSAGAAIATSGKSRASGSRQTKSLLERITEIEKTGGAGLIDLPDVHRLQVTNLGKMFFPKAGFTKGDLMRYYVDVAPLILPVMADRPLVLKRFPNGVDSEAFFQQKAPDEVPDGVRIERIHTEGGSTNRRLVGGNLTTLLYIVQLGSISVDPWHSRISSLEHADYTILDLDPGPRAPFSRVIDVARWVKEAMDELELRGGLKTSGSDGLHIYIPLPPQTPNEAATLVAQMIATKVADEHPKVATIERSVKARGAATVYVDFLQNIIGKTVAGAYSVRAKAAATVSTPLNWNELDQGFHPGDFTLETAPDRFARVGDLWNAVMKKKNSLRALLMR